MSDGSLVEAFCFRFCLIFTVSDCYTLALGKYVVIFKVCSVSGNVGRSLLGFSFTGLYCELGWLSRVLLFCFLYRRRHHAAGLGHPGARPARGLPTGQGPTERVLRTDRHGHPLALGQGNHLPGVCLCVSVCVSEFLIDRITLPSQPKCHGWRLFGRERERERRGTNRRPMKARLLSAERNKDCEQFKYRSKSAWKEANVRASRRGTNHGVEDLSMVSI